MAILNCPQCGKQISSTYSVCPYCQLELTEEIKKKELDKKEELHKIETQKIQAKAQTKQNYNKKYTTTNRVYVDSGNYGAGFALGFLLALIGLIIAYAIDKDETKRGATHGFLTLLIGSVIGSIIVACSVMVAVL